MRRWGTFLLGVVVGAIALYFILGYHVIRAQDGLYVVPKVSNGLTDTYVDITQFGPADWARHGDLALAMVQSGHRNLVESAAAGALDRGLERILGSPSGRP